MLPHPQNLSIPTFKPFKPYILHQHRIVESIPCNYKKRCYKNITNLNLQPKKNSFCKRIPMQKTLRSLTLDYWPSGHNLPLVKKLVKPYRKYLRKVQGGAKHPETLKLLPFLTDLGVSLIQDRLYFGSKKLRCNFVSKPSRGIDKDWLIKKYKTPLSRRLTKIKGLKDMSVTIMDHNTKTGSFLLEIIDQNLFLDSLEQCNLRINSGSIFKVEHEQRVSISKILAKLTYLFSNHTAWYSFLISSGELTNLSVLELRIHSKENDWGSKGPFQFRILPKLQKLTLIFSSKSFSSETNFFENLSFPSSLEDLSLTLNDFTLSLVNDNAALLNQFFERLQEGKGVKALDLNIVENATNLALTAKFYCLFIKCFENLETLDSKYMKTSLRSRQMETNYKQAKPLDFQEFLTAVLPSKETLQSISVDFNEIIFPERVNPLETGFPRLQKLELLQMVSSASELGKFCRKIPSLTDVIIRGMKFQDEERLKIFLDNMKEIPKEAKFELHLDFENIKQGFLVDCLKKYIEDVKVKGRLGIYFTRIQDVQEFGEIFKMVIDKGCFRPFKMSMVGN